MSEELEPQAAETLENVGKPRRGRPPQAPVEDAPAEAIVETPLGQKGTCKNHPTRPEHAYGLCTVCIGKMKPIEKRQAYLEARLNGVNTHHYPAETLRAWRTELMAIKAGVWKAPMKLKSKNKLAGEILGF